MDMQIKIYTCDIPEFYYCCPDGEAVETAIYYRGVDDRMGWDLTILALISAGF